MSKTKVTRKVVSTKGKANQPATPISVVIRRVEKLSILDTIRGIQFPYMVRSESPDGELHGPEALVHQMVNDLDEYRQAARAMQQSGDSELMELASDLNGYLDSLALMAKCVRGTLEKAKSRIRQISSLKGTEAFLRAEDRRRRAGK